MFPPAVFSSANKKFCQSLDKGVEFILKENLVSFSSECPGSCANSPSNHKAWFLQHMSECEH